MHYNTQKPPLLIPEYGRHVQILIDYCKTLETKEDRNHFADAIIDIMGNINPHLRDIPDFKHKLWDQLYIMADYDLDVDFPYPKPEREFINAKPKKMSYPKTLKGKKFYGKIIVDMIQKIKDWEEGDKKQGIALAIANQMKLSYLSWNKDQVENQIIADNLKELSEGKVILENINEIAEIKEVIKQTPIHKSRKTKNNRKKQSNRY